MMWLGGVLQKVAAFFLLSLGHFFAACLLPVADCDETFNFIEPIHHLLYGGGLQTWENCPKYALRSWLFTWIYASPGFLVSGLPGLRNVNVYFFNRIFYGQIACLSELFLVCSVWRAISGQVAVITLLLLLLNYPIAHAAVSALPTSFVMINYFMALGCWLRTGRVSGREENYWSVFGSVFFVVFACAVAWPFAGFAVLLMALDLIVRFPKASVLSLLVSCALIVPLAVSFDTSYYCRVTWSSWNLLLYNLKGNAELYGVEPWYYFVKNLLLNAQILFLAGVVAPFVLLLKPAVKKNTKRSGNTKSHHHYNRGSGEDDGCIIAAAGSNLRGRDSRHSCSSSSSCSPPSSSSSSCSRGRMLLYISPFFLWFTFWLIVPHKEERFMSPVFPFLVFAAALSFTNVFFYDASFSTTGVTMMTESRTVSHSFSSGQHAPTDSNGRKQRRHSHARGMSSCLLPTAGCVLLILFGVLSFSRGMAIYHFYAYPQGILYDNYDVLQRAAVDKMTANKDRVNISSDGLYTFCVGREWYRFPSSFFLDPQRARVGFLKTDTFSGALPLPFARHKSSSSPTCQCGDAGVNDLNQEIPEQYVSDAAVECDVILDSHSSHDPHESKDFPRDVFRYSLLPKKYRQGQQRGLLDVDKTPMWCRVLYYPFGISERCAVWRRLDLVGKHRVSLTA